MSRIYKKTNFAGSDSLTGIAFGGGGGGGGDSTRGRNGSPNVYSDNKSTMQISRERERSTRGKNDSPNVYSDNKSTIETNNVSVIGSFTQKQREILSDYFKEVNNNMVKDGYKEILGTSAGADQFHDKFFKNSDADKRFDDHVDKLFGTGKYEK